MTVLGFTRPSKRLKDSVKQAEDMGFTVMAAPSLEILPGEDSEFLKLESSLSDGCVAVFCSATSVEACQTRFGGDLAGMFSRARVVSIGPATTRKLEAAGLKPDSVPEEFSSYGLVELLQGDVKGVRVILIRSDSGSDVLSDGISAAGADLVDVAVYRLKEVGMSNALLHMLMCLKQGTIDVMAFSSPMSASSFVSAVERQFGKEKGDEYLHNVRIAAIGNPTRLRLTELGFPPDIVPENATFADMLAAIRGAVPE
ncbi:MAG: uroporphyrinogen-III synthase [Thermoplasmata archaeon]|nr:uroporphyrinogen-III synthase [Thermoplasmata archaeon]